MIRRWPWSGRAADGRDESRAAGGLVVDQYASSFSARTSRRFTATPPPPKVAGFGRTPVAATPGRPHAAHAHSAATRKPDDVCRSMNAHRAPGRRCVPRRGRPPGTARAGRRRPARAPSRSGVLLLGHSGQHRSYRRLGEEASAAAAFSAAACDDAAGSSAGRRGVTRPRRRRPRSTLKLGSGAAAKAAGVAPPWRVLQVHGVASRHRRRGALYGDVCGRKASLPVWAGGTVYSCNQCRVRARKRAVVDTNVIFVLCTAQ